MITCRRHQQIRTPCVPLSGPLRKRKRQSKTPRQSSRRHRPTPQVHKRITRSASQRPSKPRLGLSKPARTSELIPADTLAITPGHIDAAKRIVTERREQADALRQDHDRATRELEKLAATQRQLDQRRSREVTRPLQTLATYLERWQDVIEQAVTVLDQGQLRDHMPPRPAAITAADVTAYAAALADAERAACNGLLHAVAAAGTNAMTRLEKLDTAAAR